MSKIVGFGSVSETTVAQAKAVWPRCLSAEFEPCHMDDPAATYPGCSYIQKFGAEDPELYHQWVNDTPWCSAQQPMTEKLMWAAGGLLGGFVLGWLMR